MGLIDEFLSSGYHLNFLFKPRLPLMAILLVRLRFLTINSTIPDPISRNKKFTMNTFIAIIHGN